ncbi:SigE family RNA polymerase sigma factor [Rugosimonospora africana]|uniref:RNA polymerase sigma24 factor n=1 Tax=Rugosimonospora africana TaxID=556532 RepID=A0A8J3VV73_9ACTN|nr:SigE family RNA polymerase sigma factor [Rugosimonospora africana]GIH20322.1 RNA polymerase sigma24 factor [Rugosimonospora africana]
MPIRHRTADFDEFYQATSRRVLLHVYALTGDPAEAQDLTQEAFVRAWQRWSRVADYEDPEAWVRMVASRLAINRWHRIRRRLRVRALLVTDSTTAGPNPDRVAVMAALRDLPEAQRLVVVLHHLFEQPIADIARDTGMPVGTVKAYLSRGRARLNELLTDEPTREDSDVISTS